MSLPESAPVLTFPSAARELPHAADGETRVQRQLRVEAEKAESFGKPLAAMLMHALARVVPHSGEMGRLLDAWPGDLAQDAITFRLSAGLHALARTGRAPGLAFLYGDREAAALPDPAALDRAVLAALGDHAAALGQWIARPTQTNEVARVAGLVAVLMAMNTRTPMPCEVLELGASAGLNLNFPHYACRIGDRTALEAGSAVELAPAWRGGMPEVCDVEVVRALGVDLNPLDPACPEDCARLEAYVWPGERARSRRLAAALEIARGHPPQVAAGHAGDWLAAALAVPQADGVRRIVFHSMVMQYADPHERAGIDAALAAAGAQASPARPLVRVGMEWRADRAAVELRVTTWTGERGSGEAKLAALCHPYGEWIEWRGLV